MRLGLLALAAPLLLVGCGSSEEKASTITVAAASAGGSPTELALAHIKADETQAAKVSTVAQASPEGGGPTTVTVLQEGIADDSVAAVRHVLRYEPDGDGWRLVSSERTQRCQVGRGHQEFTAANCA
jgi:hypothetical protein